MDKKNLILGGGILVVVILVVSIIMILMNNTKQENYTGNFAPPPFMPFSTQVYDPKFSASREGSSFMIVDKNGNIDRIGITELESRLTGMMDTVKINVDNLNKKINDVQWRVEDRLTADTNKFNLFFPGGREISLPAVTGTGRVAVNGEQLGMLNGSTRFAVKNQGNEVQNRYLMYDRNSDEAKWGHKDKFGRTTDAGSQYQTDFTFETIR